MKNMIKIRWQKLYNYIKMYVKIFEPLTTLYILTNRCGIVLDLVAVFTIIVVVILVSNGFYLTVKAIVLLI